MLLLVEGGLVELIGGSIEGGVVVLFRDEVVVDAETIADKRTGPFD
jgi:hypothetical protein